MDNVSPCVLTVAIVAFPCFGVNNPKIFFNKVDFAAPFSPVNMTNSPGSTVKLMFSKTGSLSYENDKFSTEM